MNARKFINVRVSLTLTALALCGALVTSAMSTSCGSSSSGGNGGSSGSNGGSPGNGGSPSNGGNPGSNGGSTGNGGSSGVTCTDPGSDAVNFCDGLAQGAMTGYSYIALGPQDSASSPICAEDPNDLTKTRLITSPPTGECIHDGDNCPLTGHTIWKAQDDNSLCISGKIPKVQGSDYTSYWGLQIGVNTSQPPAFNYTTKAVDPDGHTLGQSYSGITLTTKGAATPPLPASQLRAVIHLLNQTCTENPYCAIMKSGTPIVLTSFNTMCWNGSTCTASTACAADAADKTTCCQQLQASDVPNIDKIGVQLSSDTGVDYDVSDFCLVGISFTK